nr:RNA-directed DNA polymerase, eukaryota [Tanacetum cinerariifolium]
MDGVGNSKTTSKTRLSQSEINSIKRQEKNEAFSKNNGDKTTNSIPTQKADHVGSSQNKKSYAFSLNGDRDSKVKKQVTAVKGNTLSNVPLTPSLITQLWYWMTHVDSAGSSGGILCVWDATIFKKDYATVSDNFIAIYGTWISNNSKVLIVVIYAPRSLSHK